MQKLVASLDKSTSVSIKCMSRYCFMVTEIMETDIHSYCSKTFRVFVDYLIFIFLILHKI